MLLKIGAGGGGVDGQRPPFQFLLGTGLSIYYGISVKDGNDWGDGEG